MDAAPEITGKIRLGPKEALRWGRSQADHDPRVLAGLRVRPTDVMISTAPKSGTTWMQNILHQLRSGGDEKFASIFDVVPWLEVRYYNRETQSVLDELEGMSAPRIFKTHCKWEHTPGVEEAKVIIVSRHPCDCMVSYFNHQQRAKQAQKQNAVFEEVFGGWFSNRLWFSHIKSWWPHRDQANVLWLRYEDMKQDLPSVIDRIIGHLGWDISQATRAVTIERSSYGWMLEHADKFSDLRFCGGIGKGIVGDREGLPAEAEKAILDETKACLPQDCADFVLNLTALTHRET